VNGNPFYAGKLARTSASAPSLDQAIWSRLDRLSEPTRGVRIVAVAGRPVRGAVALRVAAIGGDGAPGC
jgi:hypothetical protein